MLVWYFNSPPIYCFLLKLVSRQFHDLNLVIATPAHSTCILLTLGNTKNRTNCPSISNKSEFDDIQKEQNNLLNILQSNERERVDILYKNMGPYKVAHQVNKTTPFIDLCLIGIYLEFWNNSSYTLIQFTFIHFMPTNMLERTFKK